MSFKALMLHTHHGLKWVLCTSRNVCYWHAILFCKGYKIVHVIISYLLVLPMI